MTDTQNTKYTTFQFTVKGEPKAWQRAGRNKGRTYPTRVREKRAVADEAMVAMLQAKIKMAKKGVPVELTPVFMFQVPKSLPHKERERRLTQVHHTQKPDADNLVKLIKDALNEVAWHDDCQVSVGSYVKMWVGGPSATKVIVTYRDVEVG